MTRCVFFLLFIFFICPAYASSRIKDIVTFEGVRDNMLVGYGLVVGLNGTGDSLRNSVFTKQSLEGMMQRMGIQANSTALQTKNIAAVMVTAVLPPFPRQGTHLDVKVASLGDSTSLVGGELLITPLLGADDNVYAVAQGPLPLQSTTSLGRQLVPTTLDIPNGAIVEREIPFSLNHLKKFTVALRNPDFTTANRISQAINAYIGTKVSTVLDSGTVQVDIPKRFKGSTSDFITEIEQLPVKTDSIAKIIINEKSGIIVIGASVHVDNVAIAQGDLTVNIDSNRVEDENNSLPFSSVESPKKNNTKKMITPKNPKIGMLYTVRLQDLVDGLNQLGVTPNNLINILKCIKAAGALQADIEII